MGHYCSNIYPVLCPLTLPPGPPAKYWLPKFALPAGDEVPFTVTPTGLTSRAQPVVVGQGWYVPYPTTTRYQNMDWNWEAYDPARFDPAILFACREYQLLFGAVKIKSYVQISQYGLAMPSFGSGDEGDYTVEEGGGGEGETCYSLIHWWYDEQGYHEQVLASWCEGDEM